MTEFDTLHHPERASASLPHLRHAGFRLFAAMTASVLALGLLADDASAQTRGDPSLRQKEKEIPFKVAKIYFETNASACDMGIQIVFDTNGIVKGIFKDPNDRVIHVVSAKNGLLGIGGQTEGFLESVEPVVTELVSANNACDPDPAEATISLDKIRQLFPAGIYDFEGIAADGTEIDDEAELTYNVPDGPVLGSPDGKDRVNPDRPVIINWKPVTMTIPGVLPSQVEVDIVGYQVLVYDANAGEAPPEFNVTVPDSETSVTVPTQFLQPGTNYKIEVLAIEASGNQTITEGAFSTRP